VWHRQSCLCITRIAHGNRRRGLRAAPKTNLRAILLIAPNYGNNVIAELASENLTHLRRLGYTLNMFLRSTAGASSLLMHAGVLIIRDRHNSRENP
jgi:hypothetical protein